MISVAREAIVHWKDVKIWVNELYAVNGKDITRENLNVLKGILSKHKQCGYYTFHTNEKREIVISFPLGKITVRLSNKTLEVLIDEPTKRSIYKLRTNYKEIEQIDSQEKITIEVEAPVIIESPLQKPVPSAIVRNNSFNEFAAFSEESFVE